MKFWGTNGKMYPIELRQSKWPRRSEDGCKSAIQWNVSQLIDKVYPNNIVFEEFAVPGEQLFIDFLLPMKRIAIEVQGEQHFKFNKFFHRNQAGFNEHKARDSRKKEWCDINNIKLIEIAFSDDDESIVNKLKLTDL